MYEVLTDQSKRKIYDEYGEEGLEGGIPDSNNPFEFLFKHGRAPQGPRKTKSILQLVELTLADVYTGIKKKIKVVRNRICAQCGGKGGSEESIAECTACSGTGRVAKVVKMGFMISQTISACEECGGRGKTIKDKCKKCHGKTVVEEAKTLELDIDKGTPEGHRFVFNGESDEYVSRCATM